MKPGSNDEGADPSIPLPRTVTPNLPPHVLGKLSAFIEIKRAENPDNLAQALRRLHRLWEGEDWSLELCAVALLLADLIDQGWEVQAETAAIHLEPPGLRIAGESAERAKERLRRALQRSRDRQLSHSSTQRFFARMHRVVARPVGRSSVADVIEDGSELAGLLEALGRLPIEQAGAHLAGVIDPVIEVCDEQAKCGVTGLRLIDIWRYFRHTWSLEYRPIPGRQLAMLIRNAARPKRPVIGIAMLASPVVRMRARDNWIGWNTDAFLERIAKGDWDSEVALRALVARVERCLGEIRSDDLLSPDELAFPSERTILRLEQRYSGAAVARLHELEELYEKAQEANESLRSQRDEAKYAKADSDWNRASEETLFVRKRAEALARLLEAKRAFQALDWNQARGELACSLLRHPNGLRGLNIALTEVRKAGLSSLVADVSVCGAVPPYNILLGGKLVALLMTSDEVLSAYRDRYVEQFSMISSQMAGRPIYRPAELKVLTTTSLYGNGSSQYNRLRLRPSHFPELNYELRWQELTKTAGYGTVHLSATTVLALRAMSERLYRARRVNNRFGEGSSPRLRQIREAVQGLGIDPDSILHHATPRVFYGCEVHPHACEELIGLRPLSKRTGHSARLIGALWRRRWLANRIQNPTVLEKVAAVNAATIATFFANAGQTSQVPEFPSGDAGLAT